jgi:hypothetical protein
VTVGFLLQAMAAAVVMPAHSPLLSGKFGQQAEERRQVRGRDPRLPVGGGRGHVRGRAIASGSRTVPVPHEGGHNAQLNSARTRYIVS